LGRNKNHINSFIANLKAEMGRKRRQCPKYYTICDIDQQNHTFNILTSLSKQIPTFSVQWSQTLVLHYNHFSQLHVIFGYKEGHTLRHNGKNLDYEKNSCSEPFMRIKHDVFLI
jgi:hypothetical protein